jgi:hypothetical protein
MGLFIEEVSMLHEQVIEEIKQIPSEKLAEIYDLIHFFRLGLLQEQQTIPLPKRPIGLVKGQLDIPASFFDDLPDDLLAVF